MILEGNKINNSKINKIFDLFILVYLLKVVLLVIKLDHYGVLNLLKLSRKNKNSSKILNSILLFITDGIAVLLVGAH
jgi:hypothetical protein